MSEVKLSLENFRNEMDERALERGWFYFSKGWVRKPTEVLPGFYECVVNEVNPHAVSFSQNKNDEFDDVFCTCGDAATSRLSNSPKESTDVAAPWCRHLAGAIYYIEDDRKEILPENEHLID
jgi:hypothetical protein